MLVLASISHQAFAVVLSALSQQYGFSTDLVLIEYWVRVRLASSTGLVLI